MSEVLSNKWLWFTILSAVLVLVLPLVVVWFILQVSPELRVVATIAIVVLWGVVSGYKDWIVAKRREAEKAPRKR